MKNKVVILAGPSGGGKSFMEKLLSISFPENFNKLKQVTTRPMREGESQGNPYIFISEERYHQIKDRLIGQTNVNGNYYGTIFELEENKYNTIILDKGGIESFKEQFPDQSMIEYRIIMIDSKKLEVREGRDELYIQKERDSISEVRDVVIIHNPPRYVNPNDVKAIIDNLFGEES